MPVIFADNFETNIVWTKQTKTAGEAIAIVAVPGGNAAQFSTDGVEVGEMCYLAETFPSTYTDLFMRAYVLYKDVPAASKYSVPLNLRNREVSGGAVAWVQVGSPSAQTPRLFLKYNDAVGEKTVDTGIDIVANRWYCIEIHAVVAAGTGFVQLFVDGVQVKEVLNIDNSTTIGPVQFLHVGERWFSGQVPHTILVDDVVVATEYIGPVNPVVFADDFEGNVVWSKTTKTAGETFSIVTLTDNTKAAQFSTDGIEAGEMCYLQETLPSTYNELFFRAYVLYKDVPAAGKYSVPLNMRNREASGGAVAYVQVGPGSRLYLKCNDATGEKNVDTGIDIVANRWYCIEIHAVVGAGTGLVRLFMDGVMVREVLNIDNATTIGPVQFLVVGERWFTGQVPHTVLIDSVAAATEYIGPLEAPKPKLTINSSPELGVPVYIDNQFVGNTPIIVELVAGTHTVRVESEVTR